MSRGSRDNGDRAEDVGVVRPFPDSFPGRRSAGSMEILVPALNSAILWDQHGYPDPRIRWHHHREIEFHLIREGPGTMLIGDAMVPFSAGQVTMIGSDIPHMWLSNLGVERSFPRRDVFCQVHPQMLERLISAVPDAVDVSSLIVRSARVISLSGRSAAVAGQYLERMGEHSGLRRLADLVELMTTFVEAPNDEWKTLLLHDYDTSRIRNNGAGEQSDDGMANDDRIGDAISYMALHLTDGMLNLDTVAEQTGMSPTSFSRRFRNVTGRTFSDFARRLRIALACRLLVAGDDPIAAIPMQCGYTNLSNFNRRFLQETGMTPSEYRRVNRAGTAGAAGNV